MVKANEIRHVEPDDAALDKMADPHFCEVVSTVAYRIVSEVLVRSCDYGAGRASRSKPSDALQSMHRSASHPAGVANSSIIPALSLLRTGLCRRSSFAAAWALQGTHAQCPPYSTRVGTTCRPRSRVGGSRNSASVCVGSIRDYGPFITV
jgi:hypothetical protein